jgi:hypothetical protein
MRFSKIVVISMFLSIWIFTVAMAMIFALKGSVPDALIYSFFGWMGIEGGALALIKNVETKQGG